MNSKSKKILIIVCLSLVALLVITTVCLACIKTQFYDGVFGSTDAKAQAITVYHGGKDNTYVEGSAEYNKIVDLYKGSSKENVLLNIFEGAYSFDKDIRSYNTSITLNNSENTLIVFNYGEEQTLKYDGKEYKDASGKSVTFRSLIVSVDNNTNYMKEIKVYVCKDTAGGISKITPSYAISTVSKQAKLYEYITSLELI